MFATDFCRFLLSKTTHSAVRELKFNLNLAHKSSFSNICLSLARQSEGSTEVLNITSVTVG
jgi:hypothetical protein